MLVAYKDKDGNIHVESVSNEEAERISAEEALLGYANPSEMQLEEVLSLEDVLRSEPAIDNPNPVPTQTTSFEIVAGFEDEIDDKQLDHFLFEILGLPPDSTTEVERRLIRQALRCFERLYFNPYTNTVSLDPKHPQSSPPFEQISHDFTAASTERSELPIQVPDDDGGVDFSVNIFKDILRNFALGRGSLLELLQIWLKIQFREIIDLYHCGSVSFETLENAIQSRELIVLSDDYMCNCFGEEHLNFESDEERESSEFPEKCELPKGFEWKPNLMLRKVWVYWNHNSVQLLPVIEKLSEDDWQKSILTDSLFNLSPSRDSDPTEVGYEIENQEIFLPAPPPISTVSHLFHNFESKAPTNDSNKKSEPSKTNLTPTSEKEARFWPMKGLMRAQPQPIFIAKGNKLYRAPLGTAVLTPIAEIVNGKISRLNTPGSGLVIASTDETTIGKGYSTNLWLKLDGNRVHEYPSGSSVNPIIEGENCTKDQLAMAAAIYRLGS